APALGPRRRDARLDGLGRARPRPRRGALGARGPAPHRGARAARARLRPRPRARVRADARARGAVGLARRLGRDRRGRPRGGGDARPRAARTPRARPRGRRRRRAPRRAGAPRPRFRLARRPRAHARPADGVGLPRRRLLAPGHRARGDRAAPGLVTRGRTPALALLPFGACGGRDDAHTTIAFWALGREGEVVRELVPAFERLHPELRVRVQQIPWSAAHEKLLTAFAGGTLPDAIQVGSTWVPELVAVGAL